VAQLAFVVQVCLHLFEMSEHEYVAVLVELQATLPVKAEPQFTEQEKTREVSRTQAMPTGQRTGGASGSPVVGSWQPATQVCWVVSHDCWSGQSASLAQPGTQVLVVVSQSWSEPVQSLSTRQPATQVSVAAAQICPVAHCVSCRQPATHWRCVLQILPLLHWSSVVHPATQWLVDRSQ
jgi:hypothetical protein